MEKAKKTYYVGHSYMGTEFSYTSACWRVYAFDSKRARDVYLADNSYNNGQRVFEAITRKTAEKILGHSMDRARVLENTDIYKILTV